jgi:hypothetical protein
MENRMALALDPLSGSMQALCQFFLAVTDTGPGKPLGLSDSQIFTRIELEQIKLKFVPRQTFPSFYVRRSCSP